MYCAFRPNRLDGCYILFMSITPVYLESQKLDYHYYAGLPRVFLVVDGAGWHLSESVKIPKGIHLYCLPSHSPQLQPAERLWHRQMNR